MELVEVSSLKLSKNLCHYVALNEKNDLFQIVDVFSDNITDFSDNIYVKQLDILDTIIADDIAALRKAVDYRNEKSIETFFNYNVDDIADFRVIGTTLVKVSDGKITETYDTYDAIKTKLKELSEF